MIPTLFGFAAVLTLLLLATQVVFDLYARSAVTAAGVDAARAVADYSSSSAYRGPGGPAAEGAAISLAESRARAELGAYGQVTSFSWTLLPSAGDPVEVQLRLRFALAGTRYALFPLPLLNRLDRTVRVRVERLVCINNCSVVSASGGIGGSR